MKTTAIIFAAALLFGFSSCQKETITPDNPSTPVLKSGAPSADAATKAETMFVRYAVKVHLGTENIPCYPYFVEVVNAIGAPVAPRQEYVPGTNTYYFSETTRLTFGIRIAHLVTDGGPNYQCDHGISTYPDTKKIWFENEETYYFDIYPANTPPKP